MFKLRPVVNLHRPSAVIERSTAKLVNLPERVKGFDFPLPPVLAFFHLCQVHFVIGRICRRPRLQVKGLVDYEAPVPGTNTQQPEKSLHVLQVESVGQRCQVAVHRPVKPRCVPHSQHVKLPVNPPKLFERGRCDGEQDRQDCEAAEEFDQTCSGSFGAHSIGGIGFHSSSDLLDVLASPAATPSDAALPSVSKRLVGGW